MKFAATHSEEPLSTFALIVIGIEMLIIAALIVYACTKPANVGHTATWFGEHTSDARGPNGSDGPPDGGG